MFFALFLGSYNQQHHWHDNDNDDETLEMQMHLEHPVCLLNVLLVLLTNYYNSCTKQDVDIDNKWLPPATPPSWWTTASLDDDNPTTTPPRHSGSTTRDATGGLKERVGEGR